MTENTTWPGWRQVRIIGSGSFGTVYEICREDNEKFRDALKVITIPQNEAEINDAYYEGMNEKSITSYFKTKVDDVIHEIILMHQLEGHTNIVSYKEHDVITHLNDIGWDVLIKMQLLTPLQVYESERGFRLTEKETIKLGIDICEALIRCNREGIIHRDIKPQNIFVNKQGDFVLGDFGIARVLNSNNGTMSIKGSPDYMAPEIYTGQKHYGKNVDYYSLGMVLYHCMNRNRGPFLPAAPNPITYKERENATQRRLQGDPMPAPVRGSENLKLIILRATQYNPEKRFQNAEEFQKALKKALREANDEIQTEFKKQDVELFEEEPDKETIIEDISSTGKATINKNQIKTVIEKKKRTPIDGVEECGETLRDNPLVKEEEEEKEDEPKEKKGHAKTVKLAATLGLTVGLVLLVFLLFKHEPTPDVDPEPAPISTSTSLSSSVSEGEVDNSKSDSKTEDEKKDDTGKYTDNGFTSTNSGNTDSADESIDAETEREIIKQYTIDIKNNLGSYQKMTGYPTYYSRLAGYPGNGTSYLNQKGELVYYIQGNDESKEKLEVYHELSSDKDITRDVILLEDTVRFAFFKVSVLFLSGNRMPAISAIYGSE